MNIMDMIVEAQQGQGLEALGRKYNLNPKQTQAALNELAPAVMAGIRREADEPESLQGLISALGNGNHGRYLQGSNDGIVDDGNAILGHIFGSKDVSRGVAANAAQTTGIDAGTLKQMLPQVAAMVMGALGSNLGGGTAQQSNVASQGGGLGGMLGQIFGGSQQSGSQAAGGGLTDMLGGLLGGQGSSASGGGFDDLLGNLLGSGAKPEVRDRAVQKLSGAVGSALGAGSAQATAADQLLDSVGYQPHSMRMAMPKTKDKRVPSEGPRGPQRGH